MRILRDRSVAIMSYTAGKEDKQKIKGCSRSEFRGEEEPGNRWLCCGVLLACYRISAVFRYTFRVRLGVCDLFK